MIQVARRRRPCLRVLLVLLVLLVLAPLHALAAPVWGAARSSPADTPPDALQPGEWIWGGDARAMGPMAVVVSLTEQRAYVYRNGLLVAVSTVSSGKPGHETPVGVFTILQKDKDHHSSLYNNAPMPYQERLTWDGVALHAGGLPGFPESHGCVHLPTAFARLLFDATTLGMVVVIAREGMAPQDLVHPPVASPIDPATGAAARAPQLGALEAYRWTPQAAPDGPVSLVMSTADRRLFVFRGGVEIGRARIGFGDGPVPQGTRAYLVSGSSADGTPAWRRIGIPGQEADAGRQVAPEDVARVVVPPQFRAAVTPLLQPGTVLLQTDSHVLPETTGPSLQVLDADVPAL